MAKKFWSGPEIFVVIDDAGLWPVMDDPLAALAMHVEQARDTGLHISRGNSRRQLEPGGDRQLAARQDARVADARR